MRNSYFLLGLFVVCAAPMAYAQSILQDYFKGNRDSLIIQANQLIHMPEPTFTASQQPKVNPKDHQRVLQWYRCSDAYFQVRDHKKLFAYHFPKKSSTTIILIHGVGSSASAYNQNAGLLQAATQAEVYTLDLRGHGKSAGTPGDLDYLYQYTDDLVDVVNIIRQRKPHGKIILAGHSMGGGIALLYAQLHPEAPVDGYLLMAPLLGHNSPAIPQPDPKAPSTDEPYMKIHFARIIGLKMFNDIQDHSHDHLPVLFFNLPEHTPLRTYTYCANMSMAPEDYQKGLQAIHAPMLVLVGGQDEVFQAEAQYKAVMQNSHSDVHVIPDANHNSIRQHPQVYGIIRQWFKALR